MVRRSPLQKQLTVPRWQTLPSPWRSTRASTVSLSQSVSRRTTFSRLPEVSPFIQSVLRVRLKNVTNPDSRVRRRASSFMKPTISTSLLASSCTTAGTSP